MLDIIIFVVIVLVLMWKFKSVLGQEVGAKQGGFMGFSVSKDKKIKDITGEVVETRGKNGNTSLNLLGFKLHKSDHTIDAKKNADLKKASESDSILQDQLSILKPELHEVYKEVYLTSNKTFVIKQFLQGLEMIFEEIFISFERKTPSYLDSLKYMIPESIMENLKSSINAIPASSHNILSSISKIEINNISLLANVVSIDTFVEFEKIQYTTDESGSITSGSKSITQKSSVKFKLFKNCTIPESFWILENCDISAISQIQ